MTAPAPHLTLADRDTILFAGVRYGIVKAISPNTLMHQAHDEQDRFWRGGYVDAAGCRTYLKASGRRLVNRLIERGYPHGLARRVAIRLHMEANRGL